MSTPLVGRRCGNRRVLWRRVCVRGLDAALVVLVVFLIITCVVGASSEAPFFTTWWGTHLFILLLFFFTMAVLVAAVLPMLRWLRLPLDQLPDLDADSSGDESINRSGQRVSRRGLVALAVIIGVPVLVGLFYLEENQRGERAWNRYKQEQEDRGERLDPAVLVPPPVPDDQNFAATPFLAPLFDFLPGTQQPRDPIAAGRTKTLSPRYDRVSSEVRPRKVARSNSWVSAEIDLSAWHAALPESTNASPAQEVAARWRVMKSYGIMPVRAGVATTHPPNTNSGSPYIPPTRAEAATRVLAALAEAEPVLEELRAASRRPYSLFSLRYDLKNPAEILLPHYSILKHVCQVLELRASAELALGRTDEAAEDVQFIFRLIDATRDEPLLLAHLVRISEFQIGLQPLAQGLARHQWSEAQLRAFEERLRQFDFLADGRRALEGERTIFGGGCIDYLRQSPNRYRVLQNIGLPISGGGNSQANWASVLLTVAPSGWFYLEKLDYSHAFQDCFLHAIDLPGRHVSPDHCRKMEERLSAILSDPWLMLALRHQFFSSFLLPSLSGALQKVAFAQTGADAAALACALERYRRAHGKFPESLGAVVPDFINQLPHDIINGQPLHYRLTSDGQYVLYSVGWNQTDDGGVLGLTQNGSGTDQREGDWVWHLTTGP